MKFNAFFVDPDSQNFLRAEDGRWDFPTLMMEATSTLEFYNLGQRTVHKIEIVDNGGYNNVLTSDQSKTPVAKGFFQKLKVSAEKMLRKCLGKDARIQFCFDLDPSLRCQPNQLFHLFHR